MGSSLCNVAIVVLDESYFMRLFNKRQETSMQLIGVQRSKLAQLQKLSYTVVTVSSVSVWTVSVFRLLQNYTNLRYLLVWDILLSLVTKFFLPPYKPVRGFGLKGVDFDLYADESD